MYYFVDPDSLILLFLNLDSVSNNTFVCTHISKKVQGYGIKDLMEILGEWIVNLIYLTSGV